MIVDFHAMEDRHLNAQGGDIFNGFTEEGNWVCGFMDTSPGKFGFLPKNYLKFEHSTNSNRVTPQNNMSKSTSNKRSPVPEDFVLAPAISNYLGEIYEQASSEVSNRRR